MQVLGGSQPLPNTQVTRVSQWTWSMGKVWAWSGAPKSKAAILFVEDQTHVRLKDMEAYFRIQNAILKVLDACLGNPKGFTGTKKDWENIDRFGNVSKRWAPETLKDWTWFYKFWVPSFLRQSHLGKYKIQTKDSLGSWDPKFFQPFYHPYVPMVHGHQTVEGIFHEVDTTGKYCYPHQDHGPQGVSVGRTNGR